MENSSAIFVMIRSKPAKRITVSCIALVRLKNYTTYLACYVFCRVQGRHYNLMLGLAKQFMFEAHTTWLYSRGCVLVPCLCMSLLCNLKLNWNAKPQIMKLLAGEKLYHLFGRCAMYSVQLCFPTLATVYHGPVFLTALFISLSFTIKNKLPFIIVEWVSRVLYLPVKSILPTMCLCSMFINNTGWWIYHTMAEN